MRTLLAALVLVVVADEAQATMPRLTEMPAARNLQTCQQWASSQDEEAIYMWGLLESGKNSDDVGKLRLALSCLGDRPSDIVGFGSSVGAADQYCKARPRIPICRDRR